MVEHSAYQALEHKEVSRQGELLKVAASLKLLSQLIVYGLRYITRMAETMHPYLDLDNLVNNRHKRYDSSHPFTIIRPLLDHTTLGIYFDQYPGLDEMRPKFKCIG